MSIQNPLGVINHDSPSIRRTDYLYRISLKCLIRNENGEVLVVKETGSDYWDLPGGGMDHGENIKIAIAREMQEEVNLEGDYSYKVIAVDDPVYLTVHDFWQIRLIFELQPENMQFSAGEDGDKIAFINPIIFKDSPFYNEQNVYKYASMS